MAHQPSSPFASREPTDAEQKARAEQPYVYARAETLLNMAEFQWFMAECVQKAHDDAQRDALDVRRSSDERDLAAHVRAKLEEIIQWLPVMRDSARVALQK